MNPMRVRVSSASGDGQFIEPPSGARRNRLSALGPLAAEPSGYKHPGSWNMAKSAGAISAHSTGRPTLSGSAALAGGLAFPAAALIQFGGTATGALILPFDGLATITFTGVGAMSAVAFLDGAANLVLDGDATLSALAHWAATGAISISASAPSWGLGILSGTTEDLAALTPASIARAVWDAMAASSDRAGTMGEKVNAGGLDGVIEGHTVEELIRGFVAVLLGKSSGFSNGAGTRKFRDLADGKDRVVAEQDRDGNRTAVTLELTP